VLKDPTAIQALIEGFAYLSTGWRHGPEYASVEDLAVRTRDSKFRQLPSDAGKRATKTSQSHRGRVSRTPRWLPKSLTWHADSRTNLAGLSLALHIDSANVHPTNSQRHSIISPASQLLHRVSSQLGIFREWSLIAAGRVVWAHTTQPGSRRPPRNPGDTNVLPGLLPMGYQLEHMTNQIERNVEMRGRHHHYFMVGIAR